MEQITIDFLPAGATAVCHASQFDAGRVIRMNLRNDGAVYTLSGSEIIKAKITRPDGISIVENIENTASSYVDLVTSAGTCDVSGTNHGELVIEKDGATIGSKNFRMEVEEDAYGGGAGVVVESASGAIASFETDIEDELVELKAKIEPVQDLHGYTHPWAGGAGKNLIPFPYANTSGTYNGITFTVNDDGTLILNGTATATAYFNLVSNNSGIPIVAGDYILHKAITESINGLTITAVKGGQYWNATTNRDISLNLSEDSTVSWYIRVSSGTVLSNVKVYPMFEAGSTASDWEPYSNICPISGHDEVDITHTGENLDDGETVTVTFGQTVYKGYLDAKKQKIIADFVLGTFDGSNDENWIDYPAGNGFFLANPTGHISETYADGFCNILPTSKRLYDLGIVYGINSKYIFLMQVKTAWNVSTVSDLRAFLTNSPAEILYKLETPVEIQLSGIRQIETISGENNVYNDTGDTSLKYYKRAGRATA